MPIRKLGHIIESYENTVARLSDLGLGRDQWKGARRGVDDPSLTSRLAERDWPSSSCFQLQQPVS